MLYIHHATTYTPSITIPDSAVLIDGEQIVAVGPMSEVDCPAGATQFDAQGLIVAPGFIDLQFNGAFGHDFTADPSSIWTVAAQYARYGMTAMCIGIGMGAALIWENLTTGDDADGTTQTTTQKDA